MSNKILLLPPNVAKIAKCVASSEHNRYSGTSGVQVSKQDGKYRIEATDGRIAAVITGTPDNADEYPAGSFLKAAPNGAASAIVPAGIWAKAFRDIDRKAARGKPILGNLAVVLGKDVSTLSTNDMETDRAVQPRNIEGRFPDISKVTPQGKPKVSVRLSIDYLTDLLEVAKQLSGSVIIEVRDDKTPVVLKAYDVNDENERQSDQEFLGLIVPLVGDAVAQPKPKSKPYNGVTEATPVETPAEPEPEQPVEDEKPTKKRAGKAALAAAASILGAVFGLGGGGY